jgi:hypothetical protein
MVSRPSRHLGCLLPGDLEAVTDKEIAAAVLEHAPRSVCIGWTKRGTPRWRMHRPETRRVAFILEHSSYEERAVTKALNLVRGLVCECPSCIERSLRLAQDRAKRERRAHRHESLPCCLCQGTRLLEDFGPCVCTPAGRAQANSQEALSAREPFSFAPCGAERGG